MTKTKQPCFPTMIFTISTPILRGCALGTFPYSRHVRLVARHYERWYHQSIAPWQYEMWRGFGVHVTPHTTPEDRLSLWLAYQCRQETSNWCWSGFKWSNNNPRLIERSIVGCHDWSTVGRRWLPLCVRFPTMALRFLPSIFSNRCWSRDHRYDQSYDDLPPAKRPIAVCDHFWRS